jgi:hypothetical protein
MRAEDRVSSEPADIRTTGTSASSKVGGGGLAWWVAKALPKPEGAPTDQTWPAAAAGPN